MKPTHHIRHLLIALLACASLLHAEAETAQIPFSEIGAKATADSQGDAIGISTTPEGARLHTGFQKLAGNVTAEGLTLVSTGEDGGSLKLTAASIGRNSTDAPSPVIPLPSLGKVSVEEKLVRWSRPGLVEEYSVSADGVRQDFIVATAPAGTGELSVELTLSGARAEAQGDGVRFTLDSSGRELAYTRLRVEDATGRVLAARFEVLATDRLAVCVEDVGAVYPVRIDPTFSDADWVNNLNPGVPGADSIVFATVVDGSGNLYIGGNFTVVGTEAASRIAKWDGSVWSALGTGVNTGGVYSLAVMGTDLYVGGSFTSAGGVAGTSRIARWDGGAWSALGTGVTSNVNALAVIGTDLYAAGSFSNASGVSANSIAKWNGSAWSALGTGMNQRVQALAVSGASLYVGGNFTAAGGVPASRIAKWDGSAWSALGSGLNQEVFALAVSGTNLYAGGVFTTAGGVAASRIARWDGSAWLALGTGMNSTGVVNSLAVSGIDLYAGGSFTMAGGVADTRCIAKWNGESWTSLGTGLSNRVRALAVIGTDLYAGGDFTTAGGGAGCHFAKWDGGMWSALGSNTGLNGTVEALAVSGTDLYAGGSFTWAGAVLANRIAKWDGSTWSALGTGMDHTVNALAVIGTDLYAGGSFNAAGGVSGTSHIAKWDGSAWSALGTGMAEVRALAVRGTDLYAGGDQVLVGRVSAFGIAKWNGSAWSPLGTGMNSAVFALAMSGTDLYAGGAFTTAGGVSASHIAKWNGSAWSALGTGVNSYVTELALDASGQLVVGGDFSLAGTTTVAPFIVQANIPSLPSLTPVISLSGNGQNITNGDVIPDAADGTDFGSFVVTGGPAARTFTITNSGTSVLNLTGTAPDYVTVSGSNAFSVTMQPAAAAITDSGGTQTFKITFTPTTLGNHNATVSILSNDADENPFDFALSGQGVTAEAAADVVIAAAGLTEDDAELNATPFDDGVENLLKYAFNMNLAGPDVSSLPPGTGTSGLPSITTPDGAPTGTLRIEFLQRKGSGLVYVPQKSSSLDPNKWSALSATPVITQIPGHDQWERVVYTEAPDPVPATTCFGRVSVSLP